MAGGGGGGGDGGGCHLLWGEIAQTVDSSLFSSIN
jgi:hypothetical protein